MAEQLETTQEIMGTQAHKEIFLNHQRCQTKGGSEMKKIMLIGLVTLMFAGMVFAGDYNSGGGGPLTISLHNGWNLVPFFTTANHDCYNKNVLAVYMYYSTTKQYFGHIYNNNGDTSYVPSQEGYSNYINNETYTNSKTYADAFPSFWIYSKGDCSISANIGSKVYFQNWVTKEWLASKPMKTGWNFVFIAPWVIGENLKDVFSSCTVLGFNTWDSTAQKWVYPSSSSAVSQLTQSTGIIREGDVGGAFIVKVARDCYLSYSGNSVAPPSLPN